MDAWRGRAPKPEMLAAYDAAEPHLVSAVAACSDLRHTVRGLVPVWSSRKSDRRIRRAGREIDRHRRAGQPVMVVSISLPTISPKGDEAMVEISTIFSPGSGGGGTLLLTR